MIDAVDSVTVPATPTDTGSMLGMIPGPIAAFLAVLIVLVPIVSEIKGWTKGPLNKRISKAAEEAELAKAERDGKWEARDRRVEELEAAMLTMRREMGRQKRELRILHRLGDAQNKALAEHARWDREVQAKLNEGSGSTIGPPPPLYVFEELDLEDDDDLDDVGTLQP